MQCGYKKQNFVPISNPLQKLQKYHAKKGISEDRKMEILTFIFCMQKFPAHNFSEMICFASFSTDWNPASNFSFYDTHI
jgi:hypothetical protein